MTFVTIVLFNHCDHRGDCECIRNLSHCSINTVFRLGLQAGEIVTRGLHVMLGYWGDPEASAAARLPGGWLRSGDLGQMDRAGCLWLLGRIKDTVRSGGENVNAAAVEHVLLEVPGVAAAAVVGLPHDRLGEQVSIISRRET